MIRGKEIIATERELKLGLKSPLMVMEEAGKDPDEVMRSWKQYESMCKDYGLSFNVTDKPEDKIEFDDNNFNEESTQNDELNHVRE